MDAHERAGDTREQVVEEQVREPVDEQTQGDEAQEQGTGAQEQAAGMQAQESPTPGAALAASAADEVPVTSFDLPLPKEPDRVGANWKPVSWKPLVITGAAYAGAGAALVARAAIKNGARTALGAAGGVALGAAGVLGAAWAGARSFLRAPHNAPLTPAEEDYVEAHPDTEDAASLRRVERMGRMLVKRDGEAFTGAFCANTPDEAERLDEHRSAEAEACWDWLNGDDEAELAANGKHFDPEEFFARRLPPELVEVHITAEDGIGLTGHLLMANRERRRWVILAHGYTGSWVEMMVYAREWAQRGYNLLFCEMRGHGTSGGAYIGMGWLDRRDLVNWARWLVQSCCAKRIVLHGHSMGGASVSLASCEEDLPAEVVATVADSAYSDLVNVFDPMLREGYHVPAHPTIELLRAGFSLAPQGYDLGNAAPEQAFRIGARVPVLVIQGENDTFVPPYMAQRLYDALESAPDRRLVMVPGAGHCQCALADPERYWGAIDEFVEAR